MWRRHWLLFSQAVTVALGVLFVVGTLKPEWLPRTGRDSVAALPPAPTFVPPARPLAAAAGGAASAPVAVAGLAQAARRAAPTVVSIMASKTSRAANPHAEDPRFRFFFEGQGRPPPSQTGLGSGVIVSIEGYLLTNNHVVDGASEIEVQLADGRQAQARLIGTDPETDLAVLKIDLERLPVIAFGDMPALQVGDPVLAIGNPFNVGQTVTSGIVSALGRNRLGLSTFENFIQTDAAINPGNSGGALVDAQGNLIGINTAIFSRSGGSLGIGFAIPVDTARQVMESLVRDGQVRRGWIGVEPRDLTPEVAESLGLPVRQGVLITGVLAGGPAAKAGLRPGDVVLRVGSKDVVNTAELLAAVAALQPDSETTLGLQRGDRPLDAMVTVRTRGAGAGAGRLRRRVSRRPWPRPPRLRAPWCS
ncbi:MAG: trypsin-like peptidase domain-containing protein [Rubrivivax sp.]|nr:trypsin-like peptidase domain-containing protein [Rubrivivax sp.]